MRGICIEVHWPAVGPDFAAVDKHPHFNVQLLRRLQVLGQVEVVVLLVLSQLLVIVSEELKLLRAKTTLKVRGNDAACLPSQRFDFLHAVVEIGEQAAFVAQ